MGFRRSFSGWIGAITILFGLAFIFLGAKATEMPMVTENIAVGVPMWGGIFLLMSGSAIVIEVMGRSKKRQDYSLFKFPIASLIANLITFVVACIIIGLLTWAMYADYLNNTGSLSDSIRNDGLSLYVTILLMAVLLLILSLFGMFMDCCGALLVVTGTPNGDARHPGYYNGHQGPAVIYK